MNINWKADRYEVIGTYPDTKFEVGHVIEVKSLDMNFDDHPKIFRKLKWYERRVTDFNAMFSIKFCRIVETHGYWRNGDILPVCGYMVDAERRLPVFLGFRLKGYSGPENYEFARVVPATEEEFLAWKSENKISITP